MAQDTDDWFTCPVCGEVVAANALACPECGADEETGWSEQAEYDGVDLPANDEWSVDENRGNKPKPLAVWVTILMVVLILVLLLAR